MFKPLRDLMVPGTIGYQGGQYGHVTPTDSDLDRVVWTVHMKLRTEAMRELFWVPGRPLLFVDAIHEYHVQTIGPLGRGVLGGRPPNWPITGNGPLWP